MKRIVFSLFIILFLFCIPNVIVHGYGWGFNRNDDHRSPDVGKYANEIAGTSSYYIGNTHEKIIYLTFDAGYDNGNMVKILETLKQKDVKCTFFVTGDFITRESELLKMIVDDGHIVGNHTWGHKNITKLSEEQLALQLDDVAYKYYQITGQPMTKFFRPPAGEFNRESLIKVQKLGYYTFFWSIAFKDWENANMGATYSYNCVIDNLHKGAIVLMHTVSNDNVEALPSIIDEIRAQGYTIKNLDYLVSSGLN